MSKHFDVIVIGAGAAGMMCAAEAGKRGRKVWLVDHARKIGEKIRISGGGRCNFTNIHTAPANFLSNNPHFCKSALKQFTAQDFIKRVEHHGIAYHEKKFGQLFCDDTAQNIIDMLVQDCNDAHVKLNAETTVYDINETDGQYTLNTSLGVATCKSLVIATGGLSIPKIGATRFGYDVAGQFGLNIIPTRAALVPLTFQSDVLERCKDLSGVSVDATVSCGKKDFSEGLLFTHRGLSGPSILQISSYWKEGEPIHVNLARGEDAFIFLKQRKSQTPKQDITTALADILPKRLAGHIAELSGVQGRLADLPDNALAKTAETVNAWTIKPGGTEGYRTAEVTLGGVDTHELSSKTMESHKQKGLYFIGEVVDVTGHLGGFNFQWAWSSGYVAGQNV